MDCKKNRNLFWRLINRKPQTAFCFLLSVLCLTSCYKPEVLYGRWNLQGVYINGEFVEDSEEYHLILNRTYYDFFISNSLNISTYVNDHQYKTSNGYYEYHPDRTLILKFTLVDQRSEITAKIKKLTSTELRIEYEKDGDIYLLKLFAR